MGLQMQTWLRHRHSILSLFCFTQLVHQPLSVCEGFSQHQVAAVLSARLAQFRKTGFRCFQLIPRLCSRIRNRIQRICEFKRCTCTSNKLFYKASPRCAGSFNLIVKVPHSIAKDVHLASPESANARISYVLLKSIPCSVVSIYCCIKTISRLLSSISQRSVQFLRELWQKVVCHDFTLLQHLAQLGSGYAHGARGCLKRTGKSFT